ncbi:MAG: universal stress protein [Gammaproteobacteria bacterium]|nr:universal stress protein [Gammaproteobacteria bacterium]
MAIKDILLFLDDGKTNTDRIFAALNLAKQHEANLTGVVMGSMKPVHAPDDHDDKAVARMGERMAEKVVQEFSETAEQYGVEVSSLIIYGDATTSAEKMAHYARNYDLVILSQPNPKRDNYDRLLVCAKQVLLLSGRPVFFMPYIGANKIPVEKIMIAWDGTPAVSRSVHDAIPLLKMAKDVILLVVASQKQQESKREVLVDGLMSHLQNHAVNARILTINPGENSVTSVIQNQISENDIDLLVMGGHGTPTLKQKIFGTVTQNLMSSMVVPVLMSD